jgi:hypothetical protein
MKWMINILCNTFPSKFERIYQVCGSHMSAWGKKQIYGLGLSDSFD